MKVRGLVTCAALIAFPPFLWAETSVSYTHVSGSQSFDGHNLDISLGSASGLTIGGGFNTYSSDATTGTVKTYSVRIGGDAVDGSWQIFGSLTPEVNTYKAKSVGLKIFSSVPQDEDEIGSGSSLTEALLGYTRTWHTDGLPQPIDVQQNDLVTGLTYKIAKTALSANYIKSLYDTDPNSSARPSGYSQIPGLAQQPQDYPNYSISGRVDQGLLNWLKVWGSYTRVQYKVGATGSADSYSTGAGIFWQSFRITVDYNQYIPANGLSNKYISTGFGLGF